MTKTCVAAAGLYCGMGMVVPVAPTIAAMIAVIIVRYLVWTKTKSFGWNFAVCSLAMLASFVSIEGSKISVFYGFWLGVGYGALGVGIIEIGKSTISKALGERLRSAAEALFGIKPKNPEN